LWQHAADGGWRSSTPSSGWPIRLLGDRGHGQPSRAPRRNHRSFHPPLSRSAWQKACRKPFAKIESAWRLRPAGWTRPRLSVGIVDESAGAAGRASCGSLPAEAHQETCSRPRSSGLRPTEDLAFGTATPGLTAPADVRPSPQDGGSGTLRLDPASKSGPGGGRYRDDRSWATPGAGGEGRCRRHTGCCAGRRWLMAAAAGSAVSWPGWLWRVCWSPPASARVQRPLVLLGA